MNGLATANLERLAVEIRLDGTLQPRADRHLRVGWLRTQLKVRVAEGLADRVHADVVACLKEVLILERARARRVGLGELVGEVVLGQELLGRQLLLGVARGKTDTLRRRVVRHCVLLVGARVDNLGIELHGIGGGDHLTLTGRLLRNHALVGASGRIHNHTRLIHGETRRSLTRGGHHLAVGNRGDWALNRTIVIDERRLIIISQKEHDNNHDENGKILHCSFVLDRVASNFQRDKKI